MVEIALGMLVGVMLGARNGWPVETTVVVGFVAGAALYLGSCSVWPYRRCWLCKGKSTRRRGVGGSYRRASACLVCGGQDYQRLGARLLGRGD